MDKLIKVITVFTLLAFVFGGASPLIAKEHKNHKAKKEQTGNKKEKNTNKQEETGVQKINKLLTETKVFFMATSDEQKPHLRPLGLHFEADGKLFFGVGEFKNVYKQMQANPYVEIVALKENGHWLRYSGKAVFETDPKYEQKALDIMPHLKDIYNEKTGNKLAVFHLEDASAVVIPVMGTGEKLL